MDCLLFGGAPSVGKSTTIYRLATKLLSRGFTIVAGTIPSSFKDFKAVLEGVDKTGKKISIIINSATDTEGIIWDFKRFYDLNGNYDILISSVRDGNFWPRNEFFKIMALSHSEHNILEIPLGRITRRGGNYSIALSWYEKTMDDLVEHLTTFPPFNL